MQSVLQRQPENRLWRRHAILASLLVATIVFLIDLNTPLGVASGVPYSLAILIALNARSNRAIVALAILCSTLTIGDIFLGPGPGNSEFWKVITNRGLALFMMWTTFGLGMLRRKAEQERRLAEEKTRMHLTDLAHMGRLETVGQLATGLAHELNSPLAAISLQAQIANEYLGRENGRDERVSESIQAVVDEAERAAGIVKSLRDLVNKGTPKQQSIQMCEIVKEVVRLIEFRLKRAQVELFLELEETPAILGDRIQLQQVILNLLQNAIDALSINDVNSRRISVEVKCEGQTEVIVRVKDTGPGFTDADPDLVFERFFSSKPDGMGMGLAISRSIIEAHNGRLWAESRVNGGAKFEFNLPLAS